MSMITRDDIKIKIKLLQSQSLLAQATVILFDVWEEHGWKILRSNRPHPMLQDYVWIQSPSYPIRLKDGRNDWKEIVFISDRRLYELVQEMIYDAYSMANSRRIGEAGVKETPQQTGEKDYGYEKGEDESVNDDDIPF